MNKCQAKACEGGEVWVECCNGSSGCSCKGQQVFFGNCQACEGTGEYREGANLELNLNAIRQAVAATGGYLGNLHGRLR